MSVYRASAVLACVACWEGGALSFEPDRLKLPHGRSPVALSAFEHTRAAGPPPGGQRASAAASGRRRRRRPGLHRDEIELEMETELTRERERERSTYTLDVRPLNDQDKMRIGY